MRKKILVVCTGNSVRSQMAHGFLNFFAGNELDVYSAGIEAHGLNPHAVEVMKEEGIDISRQTSNQLDEYAGIEFDFVLTVCDDAKEKCPYFPSRVRTFHYNFPDPSKATGSPSAIMDEFRKVRRMIRAYISDFIKNYVNVSS
jgi:arsenate reductase (thioredoxin)